MRQANLIHIDPETIDAQMAVAFKRLPLWIKSYYLRKSVTNSVIQERRGNEPGPGNNDGGGISHGGQRKQDGAEIRRLPDVAFQPESGTPFVIESNTGVNWANYINLPAGCVYSAIPVIRFTVPHGLKLILNSIDFYFASPYAPFLCSGSVLIAGAYCEAPVCINRPCSCPYPYKQTVYGSQQLLVNLNINFSEFYIGSFKAVARGFMVEDSYPADKRADL